MDEISRSEQAMLTLREVAEPLASPSELKKPRACCEAMQALTPMHLENFVRCLELNEAFHRELWRLAAPGALVSASEPAGFRRRGR